MAVERARRTRSRRPSGSLIARAGVAILAIVWVLHGQNWGELTGVFGRLSIGYFTLALVIYAAAQLVIAFRWWVLLRAQSIRIPLAATFRLHFIGLFYNNVMPGSVGGDVLKAWYVAKHTDRRLEGALSVLVDRVVGLSGMLLMAMVAYLLFMRGQGLEAAGGGDGAAKGTGDYGKVVLGVAAVLVLACVAVLVHRPWRAKLREFAGKLWQRGRSVLGRIRQALAVYCSKPLTMLWALALTIIGQSVVVMAFWLLGRNLGIAAGPKYYFIIFPVTWVIGAVPVSIAGLGVLEAGMVGMFTRLTAAAAESALALALCQRFIWVLVSLPGGVVHLLGGHLPKEFSIDDETPLS